MTTVIPSPAQPNNISEPLQNVPSVQPNYIGGVQAEDQQSVIYHTHDGINSPTLPSSTNKSREIYIPAENMAPTTTGGCAAIAKVEAASNDVDYWVLDFDTTTAESCFFALRMPDNWDATPLTFRFVWTNAGGATTQTVAWGIKGRAHADSSAIDQAYGTEVVTTDTWLAQNDIHLTNESSPVTPAGTPAPGQWCQFKITRKVASDNMAGDARLMGVRLKYTIV